MSYVSRSPEFAELIEQVIDHALRDVHVALPGRIVSFNADKQTASVQPLVKRRDFKDGGKISQASRMPVLNGVPVVFPGARGFHLTFPLQEGDDVLLVFAHRSLDVWQANGGEVDPGDTRHHSVTDAVAIVGLHDDAHPIKDFDSSAVVLGKDDGPRVKIDGSSITVDACGGTVIINAASVKLGGSTAILGVARMGDTVQAGPFAGAITQGSTKVASE